MLHKLSFTSIDVQPVKISPGLAWLKVDGQDTVGFTLTDSGLALPWQWSASPANLGTFTAINGNAVTYMLTAPCFSWKVPIRVAVTYGAASATAIVRRDIRPQNVWLRVPTEIQCSPFGADELLWWDTDACNNYVELWCTDVPGLGGKQYQFRYNAKVVGECIFTGGIDEFYYRFTKDGKLLHSTWHVVRDKPWVPDPCESEPCVGVPTPFDYRTPLHYDWTVTRFYCLTGDMNKMNRCNPYYNIDWSSPNEKENAENRGSTNCWP